MLLNNRAARTAQLLGQEYISAQLTTTVKFQGQHEHIAVNLLLFIYTNSAHTIVKFAQMFIFKWSFRCSIPAWIDDKNVPNLYI